MNTPTLQPETDELFQVELLIARRADELAQKYGVNRGHALEHWRKAEKEVWHENEVPLEH
jgi:hypothetical protein